MGPDELARLEQKITNSHELDEHEQEFVLGLLHRQGKPGEQRNSPRSPGRPRRVSENGTLANAATFALLYHRRWGVKVESAVAMAQQLYGFSRSEIFKAKAQISADPMKAASVNLFAAALEKMGAESGK